MNHNELIDKIEALAIEATQKTWNDMSVHDIDLPYQNAQITRDLISEYRHSQQTSGISEAGQQVLDTIQLCNALNWETMR